MSINVKNINFFYGTKQILFDINFSLKKGDTVVILGKSGAGKSTLIRLFNLLEVPKSGELEVFEHKFDLSKQIEQKELLRLRSNVGMIFQQYNLWPHLSVLDNLIKAPMQVLKLSKKEAIDRAMSLLERLKITEQANRYPLMLSGGQQQRVAIARSLMMQPLLLLFDEPTAALDPEITEQIVDIINELRSTNISQIVVTHELNFARKIATHVIYMEQGRILEQGDVSCFDNPKTEEFKLFLSH